MEGERVMSTLSNYTMTTDWGEMSKLVFHNNSLDKEVEDVSEIDCFSLCQRDTEHSTECHQESTKG